MKVTEVRIGNYMLDREGRLCMVEEINKEEFKAPAIYGGRTALPNEPILITDEWLLKLGFKQPAIEITNKEFVLGTLIVYMYRRTNREVYFGVYDTKIKYVHQLQNLYFATNETELKII